MIGFDGQGFEVLPQQRFGIIPALLNHYIFDDQRHRLILGKGHIPLGLDVNVIAGFNQLFQCG